jgi:murein DD-endopeptidase MepM/ murein hydrolase activator NlpD
MSDLFELFKSIDAVKVIDASIDYSDYASIDLSETNTELSKINTTDADAFEKYIENHLKKNKAKVAFGGYKEIRTIYKRSSVFNNNNSDERNIHIGLDLWIKAGTKVVAAFDGEIHSFQNNTALGDYGPTIILKHQIEDFTFHTLYGHLSLESLADKKNGATVKKGEPIATIGSAPINGDYAPHLHFQIIVDIQDKMGDYPGVCSKNDLVYYSENCPDPNDLLKII